VTAEIDAPRDRDCPSLGRSVTSPSERNQVCDRRTLAWEGYAALIGQRLDTIARNGLNKSRTASCPRVDWLSLCPSGLPIGFACPP
jgi:hypothetical protein